LTGINYNDYPRGHGNRKRRKEIQEHAEFLAGMGGGEVDDYVEEAERHFAPELAADRTKAYKDDDLIAQGFALPIIYKYTDAAGALLYESLRYQHKTIKSAKEFRQRRPAPPNYGTPYLADAGLIKVPYHWSELVARPNEPVYWTEGEKDADRLMALGLLATTAAGQQWSIHIAKALQGRDVVILEDNDDKGREHAEKAVEQLRGWAASIRVVPLPGLGLTDDVSDWLDAGHTADELIQIAESTRPRPSNSLIIRSMPWIEEKDIPLRGWLYGRDYIRQFVSATIAVGGGGKTSLLMGEMLAMVSGRSLLGVQPKQKLRVWYWNGEDTIDELHRRFVAARKHFKLTPEDIGNRLFIESGHDRPLAIAVEDHRRTIVNEPLVRELIRTLKENAIDVMVMGAYHLRS
jgi:hypothetical protein